MRKFKISSVVISLAFVLLLIVPVLTMNRVQGKISPNENRYLASFPQLFDENGNPAPGVKSGLSSWFKDNLGFREKFVALSGYISLKVFNNSPNPKVEIGKDGWYFYTLDDNMALADGTYDLNENILKQTALQQQRIKDKLAEQGIDYVLILPPSKVSVYPEYIASGNYSVSVTADDMLANYLQENTDVKVIKLKDALLAAKNEGQVFFKTDTHWNEYGAYIGYKEIINKLNEYGVINSEPKDVNLVQYEKLGEFAGMMGGSYLLEPEQTVKTEIINPRSARAYDGELYSSVAYVAQLRMLRNPFYVYKNSDDTAKSALMFGDSMFGSWNMTELLSENFSDFTYIWDYEIAQEYIDAVKPKVVLYDMGERYIRYLWTKSSDFTMEQADNPDYEIVSVDISKNSENNYDINVTVKNTGDAEWTELDRIRMSIWKDGYDSGARAFIMDGKTVYPGEEYTFSFKESVIEHGSAYDVQMLQEGIRYFGKKFVIKSQGEILHGNEE